MRVIRRNLAAAVTCMTLATISAGARANATTSLPHVYLASPITGLTEPVQIANAGDGSGRFFIVDLPGQVRIVENGSLQPTPFLDIGSLATCRHGGLLSIAFPSDYASVGHFYVAYNDVGCNLVVARFHVSSNPDVADPATEQIVISIPMATPGTLGHSGGQLAFGPDGYLYVSMGDGSNGGDPSNLAQDPGVLQGKILRLDVETGGPATYTIPPTNPFVGHAGYRPEIWALGLRNPFRFSFDEGTGNLYIADVGEATWEELDYQPAGDPGGENYGWRIMEGTSCFGASSCDTTGLTMPVAEYGHGAGDCDINGGEVYRGSQDPALRGIYFAGDLCTGRIRGFKKGTNGWKSAILHDSNFEITGFGHDEAGNLYVADFDQGAVYRLTSATPSPVDLSVSQRHTPEPVPQNKQLTYTVQITNNSPTPALDVGMTDTLPTNVSFNSVRPSQGTCATASMRKIVNCRTITLAAGSTMTVTIVATAKTVGTATNHVSTLGNEPDPDPANNTSSQDTTVVPSADVGLTKTDATDPIVLGGKEVYTLTIKNKGPSPATGIVVTDPLPPSMSFVSASPSQGTCNQSGNQVMCGLGTMSAGGSAIVTIDATAGAVGKINNVATVTANEFDPVTKNNKASQTTTVTR